MSSALFKCQDKRKDSNLEKGLGAENTFGNKYEQLKNLEQKTKEMKVKL